MNQEFKGWSTDWNRNPNTNQRK